MESATFCLDYTDYILKWRRRLKVSPCHTHFLYLCSVWGLLMLLRCFDVMPAEQYWKPTILDTRHGVPLTFLPSNTKKWCLWLTFHLAKCREYSGCMYHAKIWTPNCWKLLTHDESLRRSFLYLRLCEFIQPCLWGLFVEEPTNIPWIT